MLGKRLTKKGVGRKRRTVSVAETMAYVPILENLQSLQNKQILKEVHCFFYVHCSNN